MSDDAVQFSSGPVDVEKALSELAKMASFAKVFADAQFTLDALAGAQQLGKELAALAATRRAELDDATTKLADAKTVAEKTRVDADAYYAARCADGDAVVAAARKTADKVVNAAQQRASQTADNEAAATIAAAAAIALKQTELGALEAQVADKTAELAALEAKVAAMKDAARAVLS